MRKEHLRPRKVIKVCDLANSLIVDHHDLGWQCGKFFFPIPIHGMDSCITT